LDEEDLGKLKKVVTEAIGDLLEAVEKAVQNI